MSVPVNFNFIEQLGSSLELPGLAISTLERTQRYNWLMLDMHVLTVGDGVRVEVGSRQSQFSAATIKGFLEDFGLLLRRVVSESNHRLVGKRPTGHTGTFGGR